MTETKSVNTCDKLTRGDVLARNTIFSLLGQGLPLVVAIFTIPLLTKGLGTERFGVLTLAWMVVGYFSIFDFGLGRVLTKVVSEKLGGDREDEIPTIVWTCLLLMLILGAVATFLVLLLSPWLVYNLLKVPEELQQETLRAFVILGISIPVVISTVALKGILEAHQRFGIVNIVNATNGLFTFLGPLLALSISSDLGVIVTVLTAGRWFFWLVYLLICFRIMPSLGRIIKFKFSELLSMLRLGGWMTVSNVVGPIMVCFDRFLIGALVSIVAVAYYATPYEAVVKLWILTFAVTKVLFPAFARCFATDPGRTAHLFARGTKLVFVVLFPIIMIIVTLADSGLELWLGKEFAQNSTRVLQWLAIGVLLNSPAQICFALIQAAGRPDLTAKVHLIELPFYIIAVWLMTRAFGIEGAAIMWAARVTVDAIILFEITRRLLKESRAIKHLVFMLGSVVPFLSFGMLPMDISLKVALLVVILPIFAIITWFKILSADERHATVNWPRKGYIYKRRITV